MKKLFIFLLIYSQMTNANIAIRNKDLEEKRFFELTEEKQAIPIGRWLIDQDLAQSQIEILLTDGERYLNSEITFSDFISSVNRSNEKFVFTPDSREALVDILFKKSDSPGEPSNEIWEQICYFYSIDEKIQLRWPHFYQKCTKNKNLITLEKPQHLNNDIILVDGVEWKDKIKFYPRNRPDQLQLQIRIYSNSDSPVMFNSVSLSIPALTRQPLVSGECHQIKTHLDSISSSRLPLPQVFVLSKEDCIDPALKIPMEDRNGFWQENKKWLWITGIIAVGLTVHHLKDQELTFDWP